jgi:hypothetical protein
MDNNQEVVSGLAKDIVDLVNRIDELKAQAKQLEGELNPLKENFLTLMKNQEIDEMRMHGSVFRYKRKLRASVLKTGGGLDYLREHDLGHLIKEEVDSRTLAKVFNDLSEAGQLDLSDQEAWKNNGISVFMQDLLEVK